MPENKLNILIVEDERIIAIDLRKTLEKIGYNVCEVFSSGEEALVFLEKNRPNLILMDIMLAGELTGIDTALIVSEKFDIPVVYLTAYTDSETLQKAKITEPYGYLPKPFEANGLHTIIEMAVYKHRVERQLREKTRELEEEKLKTDQLLLNIFPSEIVKELKLNGSVSPRLYPDTTILFTNFYDFSGITTQMAPSKIVGELNDIYHQFDLIVEEHELEKLKTFGDSYMIGGGIPKECDDHALKVVKAAFKMHEYLNNRNMKSEVQWKMKAGINTGQVVAGIVGMHKYTYDIWGDSVNIASRMESSCEPGKINISGSTYNKVKCMFDCEYRGKLKAKGKGEIDMYFVKGLKKT